MGNFEWGVLVGAVCVLFLLVAFRLLAPWVRARTGGARVTLLQVLAMRLRGCPPGLICDALVARIHQGKRARLADVEAAYLANRSRIRDVGDLLERMEERE